MEPRRWLLVGLFMLGAFIVIVMSLAAGATAYNVTRMGEDSRVHMRSDNNLLFNTGGGHITWDVDGPVCMDIRKMIDLDHDWIISDSEASTYTSNIDQYLTELHLVYHGAKTLRFDLLDNKIDTDTSGLIGSVNSSSNIEINFLYDATPAQDPQGFELSDDVYVRALFEVFNDEDDQYKFVGKVEIVHYNTFVGVDNFDLPRVHDGQITHYVLPLVDYYEYSISYKGDPKGSDFGHYDTFDPILNSMTMFVIFLVMWLIGIAIPKWAANHYNKRPIFGIRASLALISIAAFMMFVLDMRSYLILGASVGIVALGAILGIVIYGRTHLAKDLDTSIKDKDKGPSDLDEFKDGSDGAALKKKPSAHTKVEDEEAPPIEEKQYADFEVQEIFYIYKDGRVISHCSSKGYDSVAEKDLVGSMLVAIQGFVTDSFRKDGQLDGFDYGDSKISVMTGNHGHLVLVIEGVPPDFLRERLAEVVQKVEGMFAGVIEDWDGSPETFKGINAMITPLLSLKDGLNIRARPEIVKVKSAVEFFEGFIRLKIGIINERRTSITNSSFRLTFDKQVLRLNHIDPAYPMDGTAVELGVIAPSEKKSIAFYLDPLICQVSNIDGAVTYRDYKGQFQTAVMKRRPAEILCPIFFTPKTINVAMLKRLKEDLPYTDSRVFKLPLGAQLKRLFELAKETVMAHNVKMVKEFLTPIPFVGEAWLYGKTAETQEEMIIKVLVHHETQSLQIWVAANNLATQAGLLAEVGHEIGKKVKEIMSLSEVLLPSTDDGLKTRIEGTSMILDTYSEGKTSPADGD